MQYCARLMAARLGTTQPNGVDVQPTSPAQPTRLTFALVPPGTFNAADLLLLLIVITFLMLLPLLHAAAHPCLG